MVKKLKLKCEKKKYKSIKIKILTRICTELIYMPQLIKT